MSSRYSPPPECGTNMCSRCRLLSKPNPTLVGYYRLLLGVSQKRFYVSGSGFSAYKSLELRGFLNQRSPPDLAAFCRAMNESLAELVRQLSPRVTSRDVSELALLTLGAQFQGGNNNTIGQHATTSVFLAVTEIVRRHITAQEAGKLTLRNSSGRTVIIALASDPDIRIQEDFGGALRNKVAIEIKGGTDKSNAHNRAGEAEKSHQKAKKQGFPYYWTIISKAGLNMDQLQAESPTTTSWFDIAQGLARQGNDWVEFRSRFVDVIGIPL